MIQSYSNNDNEQSKVYDFLDAIQQYNLVYNYDFRYYSNQIDKEYGIPDGWLYNDSGANGTINFDPYTNQNVIVTSNDGGIMSFRQHIQEFPRWKEALLRQKITAKVILNLDVDATVSVILSDGIDSDVVIKTGSGDFEIEVQLKVNTEAELVYIAIESASPSVTISVSKAYANIGKVAIQNLPCIVQGVIGERKQYLTTENPPTGEFSICTEPVELSDQYTRLDSVLKKRYGTGSENRSLLPDMRGYFSRAWDNGAGIDPDANKRRTWGESTIKGDHVSTLEEDEFLLHDHGLVFSPDRTITPGKELPPTMVINTVLCSETQKTGGKETRPKNITELYTIKWA